MIAFRALKYIRTTSLLFFSTGKIQQKHPTLSKGPVMAAQKAQQKNNKSNSKLDKKGNDLKYKENYKIDYKKYNKEVAQILSNKKQLIDVDLAFLAQQISNNSFHLDPPLILLLKQHLNLLKDVNISLLPALLELSFALGIVNPPQLFIQCYLQQIKTHSFNPQEHHALPSYFLKKVGGQTVLLCLNRSIQEGAGALRFFGSVLSLNQLKVIDDFCTKALSNMTADQTGKLLAIFRQLKKRGTFVAQAEQLLIQKQNQLSPKALLTTLISFYELENREAAVRLQDRLCAVVSNGLSEEEVVTLIHILHKYKAGGGRLWQQIQTYLVSKYAQIPFVHLFMVMSGLCRNYTLNQKLLKQLIDYDSSLSYAHSLQEKQFVEFYFVLYAYYAVTSNHLQQLYSKIISSAIKEVKLTSVYCEIQSFLLFLLEFDTPSGKEYLRKSYPDDNLLALLSIIYPFPNTDTREQQAYEADLVSRYGVQIWQRHKKVLVAEEFIRYKLVSTMEHAIRGNQ